MSQIHFLEGIGGCNMYPKLAYGVFLNNSQPEIYVAVLYIFSL